VAAGAWQGGGALDEWCKDVAPSEALRRWFAHDPDKWPEFTERYAGELAAKKDLVVAMLDRRRTRTVTLLYAAKDPEHNNAVALKRFIDSTLSP